MKRARGFKRLPLFWKLLVPYVVLLVIVGSLGAFLITRYQSARAQSAVNEQLLQASLKAKALLYENELYLLESANLAANLSGIAEAVRTRDVRSSAKLMASVLALKDKLGLVVVADLDGNGLVEFSRAAAAVSPKREPLRRWAQPFVLRALADPRGGKAAGLLESTDGPALAIASPICSGNQDCSAAGVAIVAMRTDALASVATGRFQEGAATGLAIFDARGRVLATSGATPGADVSLTLPNDLLVRRTERAAGEEVYTLYAPFEVQGNRVGMIAVSLPSAPALDAVRGAALRLLLVLAVALAGIVAVGALLSRFILSQTRPLLATNRALGKGDLSARAPVVTEDEIGELARGLNQMAEQLQASYETLEGRVSQRTEEVHRLLRERTEFFASLSHELRTPIALIISHAEMLLDPAFPRRGRSLDERGRVMLDSGKQLLAMVNDILDLARLESGGGQVDVMKVSLKTVIESMRTTMMGLASGADVRLSIELPPDLPQVFADPARLREALLNIVDNAVKYTPSRGRVKLTASGDAMGVAVSVADSGVGIPAEDHERVFEPFFRARSTTTQRGEHSTGLGLAIAKRLVEAQSGAIALQSAPGEGTVVTVRIPSVEGPRPLSGRKPRRSADTPGRPGRGDGRRGQGQARVS